MSIALQKVLTQVKTRRDHKDTSRQRRAPGTVRGLECCKTTYQRSEFEVPPTSDSSNGHETWSSLSLVPTPQLHQVSTPLRHGTGRSMTPKMAGQQLGQRLDCMGCHLHPPSRPDKDQDLKTQGLKTSVGHCSIED